MQDMMIEVSGDLVVTQFGDLAVVLSNDDDIIQMANNNILTRLGENIYHPEIGNDAYNRRLKVTASGFAEVETSSKDAILYDTRVKGVTYINASRGTNLGECVIIYTILTTDDAILDGRISVNLL